MIKGLINGIMTLFSSGLILNPMVLLGIAFALYLNTTFSLEDIFEIYKDFHVYLMAVLIGFIYIYFFKKPYKLGGKEVDYSEMSMMVLGAAFKLVFSSILMTSFIAILFF